MKKFLFTLVSLLFISTIAVAQRSTITKFEGEELAGLIVTGAFDVNISYGERTKVEVNLPDDAVGKISIELTDEKFVRLGYGTQFESYFVGAKNRPKATIVLAKLSYINLSGSSMLIGSGTFTAEKFVMTVSGNAFASFVMVDCVEAAIDASGVVKVEDVRVVATSSAQIIATGSSKVQVGGKSPVLKVVGSGTSKVDLLGFNSEVIDAITSGTSLVKATVNGTAKVVVGGMSGFRYVGNGVVTGDGARKL